MRSRPGPPEVTAAPVEASPSPSGLGTAGGTPWWVGSSAPIVLRVPRGLAVVICLALVGLIVLAYFVGVVRGSSGLEARVNTAVEVELLQASQHGMAPPDVRGSKQIIGRKEDTGVSGAKPGTESPRDPRKPGLNYMVLATLPGPDAIPLVDFLRDNGVETILVSVTVRGSEQVKVVAVNKGFEGAELNSQARGEYQSMLRTLGRAWKRHNGNRGDALGTMYFDKYVPPDGAH